MWIFLSITPSFLTYLLGQQPGLLVSFLISLPPFAVGTHASTHIEAEEENESKNYPFAGGDGVE